jgi:macrolide transport system ATP-binding/permease protein
MGNLIQDLRYGFRLLLKKPGFTVVAVLVLALGIGVNTTIFSLVNALLLRELPGTTEPQRLVAIYTSDFSSGLYGTSSYPDYVDYRDKSDAFSGIAAYYDNVYMNLASGAGAERVTGALVTGNYFEVLGAKTRLGRTLLASDDLTPGGHPVVVLSHETWEKRFGSDQNVVGKTVNLNNQSFTVIGVASEDFKGNSLDSEPGFWIPISMLVQVEPVYGKSDPMSRRGARWLGMIGRLKEGATLEQAHAQVNTIAAALAQAYPKSNLGTLKQPDKPRPMTLVRASEAMLHPSVRNTTRRIAQLLMVVVGLVLLIACANVANLLLARARGRQKEIAVRLALGARRTRIVRQMLTESMMLSILGGAFGLLLAIWLSDIMLSTNLLASFQALDPKLDARVLGFTLIVSLMTGLLFGLAPALQASKPDLVGALKDAEPGSGQRVSRLFSLRNILVISQVALSLMLLVGAGLFLRSLQKAYASDLGFKVNDALLASVDVSRQGYTEVQGKNFFQQLQEHVAGLPGVTSVSLASYVPVDAAGSRTTVVLEGYEAQAGEDLELNINTVGLRYFETMGIPLLMGRDFSVQDAETSPGVIIVNETLANKYWPGQNAVGKRIKFGGAQGKYSEIIGVTRTGKYRNVREEAKPYIYRPFMQRYQSEMTLIVRTDGNPTALLSSLRNEVQKLDRNLPLFDVKTLNEHLGAALAEERTNALLVGSFGLLALLLAAVGIYGLMSYAVTQRTHEIGIRMALGAKSSDVLKLILWESLKLAVIGVALGLLGAMAVTRLVSSMLFETSATDPGTFIVVALILTLVMLLASYIPARRATKVDPMIALRYE